jgi:hypothetical protein
MNICPVGAKLLHMGRWTDGRTDMTKLIAALHNSANVPKKFIECYSCPLSMMSIT